jgi:hypothetical protein
MANSPEPISPEPISPEPTGPRSGGIRSRRTPISDGLGADLHSLGTILASHTRGLGNYLQRQAQRLDEREQQLLAETANALTPDILTPSDLLPADYHLEAMSVEELKKICREQQLRRWSHLRRDELIIFLRQALGQESSPTQVSQANSGPASYPPDANRSERLLLLLLRKLNSSDEEIDAAWGD